MLFNFDMIQGVYARIPARVEAARKQLGRPLTLAEKIIYSHLIDGAENRTCRTLLPRWPFCSSPPPVKPAWQYPVPCTATT